MKIKPKDIIGQDVQLYGIVSRKILDIDTDYWWLDSDIDVTIIGNRVREYIRLDVKAKVIVTVICCRCLREVHRDVIVGFSFQKQVIDELEEIDIGNLVREELVLSMGLRHLCSSNCKGICPNCGKDLNEGACSCNEKST